MTNSRSHHRVQKFVTKDCPCLGSSPSCAIFLYNQSLVAVPHVNFSPQSLRQMTNFNPNELFSFMNDMYMLCDSIGVSVTAFVCHSRDWNVWPGIHLLIRVAPNTQNRLENMVASMHQALPLEMENLSLAPAAEEALSAEEQV